jgi:para-nitrobenzyl esterase
MDTIKIFSDTGIGSRMDRRTFVSRASLLAGAGFALPAFYHNETFAQEPVPGAVVDTANGKLRGTTHNGIHAFKGIPYGESTAGKNRFLAPVKPAPWTGVRDAFRFGHWSPQNIHFVDVLAPQADDKVEGYGEDCLCLNVWTPGTSGKRPVMFWCHGGGFNQESGSWPWYYGESLARRGAVVVTINHRLNIFGYFHLGDIGGERYAASGNAGMLDLVAGLQWVHDNIAQFGGDPDNVMIFGESGGGAKVSALLTMPAAKSLFHRAVIQSGANARANPREGANEIAEATMSVLGIKPDRVDDLQGVPVSRLLSAMADVQKRQAAAGRAAVGFSPVVDGKIMPTQLFDPVAPLVSATIPMMIGCNTHEQSFMSISAGDDAAFGLDEAGLRQRIVAAVGEAKATRVISAYRKTYPNQSPSEIYFLLSTDRAERLNSIRRAERKFAQGMAPVYMYLFAWRSPALGGKLGAPHTVEIPFVFDNTDIPKVMTTGSPAEKELAAKTSEAWIQFARSGNPNHKGLPNWPAYTTKDRATMVFDNNCKIVNDPGSEERKLWASL